MGLRWTAGRSQESHEESQWNSSKAIEEVVAESVKENEGNVTGNWKKGDSLSHGGSVVDLSPAVNAEHRRWP